MAEVRKQGRQRELAQIEALFHGLIRSRCREGGIAEPENLPLIANLVPGSEEHYFAVPGMYGGFSFGLHQLDGEPFLIASSWVRIVEGSGMRHRITPTEVLLEEVGFV